MAYFGATQRIVGDPGFFSTLGAIAKGVARGAAGFASGGVLGGIGALVPQRGGGITQPGTFPPRFQLPGGLTLGSPIERTTMGPVAAANGMCPRGTQPAKVYVRGQGYQRVGKCVKIRRRNPFNPQAARKSAARLQSLGKGLGRIKKSVGSADRTLNPKRSGGGRGSRGVISAHEARRALAR